MRNALARRRQLGGRDQVDVEPSVAVEVDERHPAASRLQHVVLRGRAAVAARGQACRLLELRRRGWRCGAVLAPGGPAPAPAPSPRRGRRTPGPSPSPGCSCPGGSSPAPSLPRASRARARAGRVPAPHRSAPPACGPPPRARSRRGAARPSAPGRAPRRPALPAARPRREARAGCRPQARRPAPPASAGPPRHAEVPSAARARRPPQPQASRSSSLPSHTGPATRRQRPAWTWNRRGGGSVGPPETRSPHSGPQSARTRSGRRRTR